MAEQNEIKRGTRLRVRDASGRWREKVATSGVESCLDATGRLAHDFAGVYVRNPDSPDDYALFWPLEDVEVVSGGEG